MEIIHENEYVYKMNDEIEPYLATHRQEGYIPGAEDHLHRKDTGIVGKIHVQRYLAEKPKGVIIISHGFTEAAPTSAAYRSFRDSSSFFSKSTWSTFAFLTTGPASSVGCTASSSPWKIGFA